MGPVRTVVKHRPGAFEFAPVALVLTLMMAIASVPARAAEPLRVLVIGDSLSAAYNIPVRDGWVALLEARLAEWASERGLPAPMVVNASVSGDTTGGGRSRLPRSLTVHEPDLVVVGLGGNDGLRGQPVRASSANLEAMLSAAIDAGAGVAMLGVRMPPNYGPAYTEAFARMFDDVAARHDVPLAPRLLDGIALTPGLMQADGIHPTAEAQGRVLDNAWPAIEAALQRLNKDS